MNFLADNLLLALAMSVALAAGCLLLPAEKAKAAAARLVHSDQAKLAGLILGAAGFAVLVATGLQIQTELRDHAEQLELRRVDAIERFRSRLLSPTVSFEEKSLALQRLIDLRDDMRSIGMCPERCGDDPSIGGFQISDKGGPFGVRLPVLSGIESFRHPCFQLYY